MFVCLFVHGVPVVCGGRRITKEGPYRGEGEGGLLPVRGLNILKADSQSAASPATPDGPKVEMVLRLFFF